MDAAFVWKLSKLGHIVSSRLRFDDDFSDRLNYQFTVVLLFMFIGLLGIRQYVGKPIQCWIPQEFTRGWEEYTENYCWVSNTYFAPIKHSLPPKPDRDASMIGYYQWAPIVLAMQALLFFIPCLMWRLFMGYSGFNVRRILQMAMDSSFSMPDSMYKNVRFMARYIETCIYRQRDFRRGVGIRLRNCFAKCTCVCCGRRYGNYLVVLYFTIKFLYIINILAQLSLMEAFIGTNYTFYGIRVLYDLAKNRNWEHSGHFPRVTFCDFEAKKLGKNHRYSLQCVLPLNMFLEKIYIFLWFWHVALAIITLVSALHWFAQMGFSRRRVKFIRKYLKIMNMLRDTDNTTSRKFVENYLRPDGVFLIRLISINCGDILAGDLTCELWNIYRHKRLHEIDDVKYASSSRSGGGPGAPSINSGVPGSVITRLPPDYSQVLNNAVDSRNGSNNNQHDDSIV
jgi:innexin